MELTATWEFTYGINPDGTPKIESEMSPEEYDEYKQIRKEIYECLVESNNNGGVIDAISHFDNVMVDKSRFDFINQNCDECKRISYPCKEDSSRTLATSGEFPIMAYVLLKHYGKNVNMEDIVRIANYGDWHHTDSTCHYFLDVVLKAYGIKVVRITLFIRAFSMLQEGNNVVSLMNQRAFPNGKGNTLILITQISDGMVEFYMPANGEKLQKMPINTFVENVEVLWGIESM